MYLNDLILMGQYPAYIHIIEAVETGTTGKGVGRRYDLGVGANRVSLCLGTSYALSSASYQGLPMQATDVSRHEAPNDVCAYVPTEAGGRGGAIG